MGISRNILTRRTTRTRGTDSISAASDPPLRHITLSRYSRSIAHSPRQPAKFT